MGNWCHPFSFISAFITWYLIPFFFSCHLYESTLNVFFLPSVGCVSALYITPRIYRSDDSAVQCQLYCSDTVEYGRYISSTMDLECVAENAHTTSVIKSPIPPPTLKEPCCVGIDEAGRGPVLGPMVYGIAYCPVSKIPDLTELGVNDSKQLKESDRERILAGINENNDYIGWCVKVLSSNFISNSMLGRENYNLNAMSHDTAISLLQGLLDSGINVQDVYVDTVGPADKYQAKLSGIFPALNITVASKADAKFPICGASSICAKVARDKCIETWANPEGNMDISECGSGYPGDPNTKDWLRRNVDPVFGFPQFVRFSWSTAENIMQTYMTSNISLCD
eukprot:sb/3466489/